MKKTIGLFVLLWSLAVIPAQANVPIGYFDGIDGGTVISGWAVDMAVPSQELTYQVFVDGAGGDGLQIGAGTTNLFRGDVNAVKGITGNHGFKYAIPAEYLVGYRKFYVHIIDPHGIQNPLLEGSPKSVGTPPNGDQQLAATVLGKPLVIRTSNQFAGAIYSLKWDGFEFIDAGDHGRQMQTAIFYDGVGECFGPTEAGSAPDGTKSTSSSQLQYISVANNTINTQTRMAFWNAPNFPDCPGLPQYYNKTITSNNILRKNVKLGYNGVENVLEYDTDVYASENHWAAFFEIVTGYMPPSLRNVYQQNIATGAFERIASANSINTGKNPVVVSTDDGSKAMGVFTPQAEEEIHSEYTFTNFSNVVTKWNTSISRFNVPQGHYKFKSFVFFGTLAQVEASMQQVRQMIMPTFDHNPIGARENVPLEGATCAIRGWVCDKDRFDLPLTVQLMENGVVVAEGKADMSNEPAVSNLCGGTGGHRFKVVADANSLLRNGALHNVEAYALDIDKAGNPNGNKTLIQDNNSYGSKAIICSSASACNKCSATKGCQKESFTAATGECSTALGNITYTKDCGCPSVSGGDNSMCQQSCVQPTDTCAKKNQGDADCKDGVTLADFALWKQEFLKKVNTITADFSGNGTVELEDFALWKKGFLGQEVVVASPTTVAISAVQPLPDGIAWGVWESYGVSDLFPALSLPFDARVIIQGPTKWYDDVIRGRKYWDRTGIDVNDLLLSSSYAGVDVANAFPADWPYPLDSRVMYKNFQGNYEDAVTAGNVGYYRTVKNDWSGNIREWTKVADLQASTGFPVGTYPIDTRFAYNVDNRIIVDAFVKGNGMWYRTQTNGAAMTGFQQMSMKEYGFTDAMLGSDSIVVYKNSATGKWVQIVTKGTQGWIRNSK